MNKDTDKLLSLEWRYCILFLAGFIIFFASIFGVNYFSRTLFIILFVSTTGMMLVGSIRAGAYSGQRKKLINENFEKHFTRCPHCSGKGWVKK